MKVADEANEASAQKQEIDANAAAAKETKEKDGSTANSQERNEEEFTKDNDEIHNKTETANETTTTNGTDDATEVATHKLNVDAAQNLCDCSSVTASDDRWQQEDRREYREEVPQDLVDVASAAATHDDRRQCRRRVDHHEGSLQVGNRPARLLSRVCEIDPVDVVAVASEDRRQCSDRLGLREVTPQDFGWCSKLSSIWWQKAKQQSSGTLWSNSTRHNSTRAPRERREDRGDNVIDLCDTSRATDSGDRRQCGGRLKQHEETPLDAIRPARCVNVVQLEGNVYVRDALLAMQAGSGRKRQSSNSKRKFKKKGRKTQVEIKNQKVYLGKERNFNERKTTIERGEQTYQKMHLKQKKRRTGKNIFSGFLEGPEASKTYRILNLRREEQSLHRSETMRRTCYIKKW